MLLVDHLSDVELLQDGAAKTLRNILREARRRLVRTSKVSVVRSLGCGARRARPSCSSPTWRASAFLKAAAHGHVLADKMKGMSFLERASVPGAL
eukprot:5619238-Alexandrium_andersonii.AAC.1